MLYLKITRYILLCLFPFIFLISLSTTYAQGTGDLATESVTNPPTTGSWNGIYNTWQIGKKTFFYAETHYRRRNSLNNNLDFVGRMGQLYNRGGIKYLFNDYFNVTFGPTLVFNFTPHQEIMPMTPTLLSLEYGISGCL
ncbi:MAG: DUF2490 domain-containing protein [Cyclobacteriaceae bacterium]|nr:DUF2490 domain-containing protein [Cyclobacteriaceae bacterium]